MKMVFVGLSLTMLLSTAGSALSQARPDSLRMTCNQARAFVAARGAVILGSGPHIYDRIVSDQRFCTWPQGVQRTTVPTSTPARASSAMSAGIGRNGHRGWSPDFRSTAKNNNQSGGRKW